MASKTRRDEYAGGFPDGLEAFRSLEDPRTGNNPNHYFGEVLFIALAAMICGCEGFEDFERLARLKAGWLGKHLKLPNGTPSNDTFRRIFTRLKPREFCNCFTSFVMGLNARLGRQLIAIDGKTLRHSFEDADPTTSLHLISAWACESQLSLGQLAVDGKSNEITAVPKLVRQLDIKGHVVSLDAMGCQKKIAQEIHFAGGDYLLALKANHETLHDEVRSFMEDPACLVDWQNRGAVVAHASSTDGEHGRIEERQLSVTNAIDWIDAKQRKHWLGLTSLVRARTVRHHKSGGEGTDESRYYLTSLPPDAEELLKLVRQHWSIENQCHWVLEMTFGEDRCRVRKGNAPENLALLRKMALSLLKHDTSVKDSVRGKRLQAILDEKTLETFLCLPSSR